MDATIELTILILVILIYMMCLFIICVYCVTKFERCWGTVENDHHLDMHDSHETNDNIEMQVSRRHPSDEVTNPSEHEYEEIDFDRQDTSDGVGKDGVDKDSRFIEEDERIYFSLKECGCEGACNC